MLRRFILFLVLCFSLNAFAALSPELAFRSDVAVADGAHITMRFDIAKKHYLYRDKFSFLIEEKNVTPQEAQFPVGKTVDDYNFGTSEVYFDVVQIELPLKRIDTKAQKITLHLGFQGCAEGEVCYPPQTSVFTLDLPEISAAQINQNNQNNQNNDESSNPNTFNESARLVNLLQNSSVLWIALSFFGFGLLLSFTPCTLPALPILSSLIAGQGKTSALTGFLLSALYVLGMSLTSTILGVLAGFSGSFLGAFLQAPLFLGAIFIVLSTLAFSLLGFYELPFLGILQNNLLEKTAQLSGGKCSSVFLMGAFSSILMSACVAAPLAAAFLFIGQTGNAAIGGIALFSLSFGMGAPLLVIGASAGKLLPKAGKWMISIKKFFGVLLLATALWVLSPLIEGTAMLLVWAVFFAALAFSLGVTKRLAKKSNLSAYLQKSLATLILLSSVLLLVGALQGAKTPFSVLDVLLQKTVKEANARFTLITSLEELNQIIATSQKPVMLDLYADWCRECVKMDRTTFVDASVEKAFLNFTVLRIDLTKNNKEDQALLKNFSFYGPPGILFFKHGKEIKNVRLTGLVDAPTLLAALAEINALKND